MENIDSDGKKNPLPQRFAKISIKDIRLKFEETNNPLYVWKAYLVSRESNIQTPEWVAVSIEKWANELLEITAPGKKGPDLVYQKLGLSGGCWREIETESRHLNYALFVSEIIDEEIEKIEKEISPLPIDIKNGIYDYFYLEDFTSRKTQQDLLPKLEENLKEIKRKFPSKLADKLKNIRFESIIGKAMDRLNLEEPIDIKTMKTAWKNQRQYINPSAGWVEEE